MKLRFFSFLWAILFVLLLISTFFLRFEDAYDFHISQQILQKNSDNSFNFSVSQKQNIWYVGINKEEIIQKNISPEDVCVRFELQNKNLQECLDAEDEDETSQIYSFPLASDAMKVGKFFLVDYHSQKPIDSLESVSLYSLNTQPSGKKLTFHFDHILADGAVTSRQEWGADETIRYTDNPKQQERYKKFLSYQKRDKTDAELKNIAYEEAANNFLKKDLGPDFETTSLIRTENGHRLVWPIQKVKKVNRIIVHHTADSLDGTKTDEELIRGIYAYHAITRGWGDIGYNYIIGQTGKIYEWRAGGDYVVGAHASYNNIGTVGISVLGNFQDTPLNAMQENGLTNAISFVAKKYGITLTSFVDGYKKCTTASCYPLQKVRTRALLGHRDVGVTSCPGHQIHNNLWKFITELNREYTPVLNVQTGIIEEKPAEEVLNTQRKQEGNTSAIQTQNTSSSRLVSVVDTTLEWVRYFGQKFRVKLSYPHESISLQSYGNFVANAYLDYIRKPIYAGTKLEISPLGNDKILLKIGDTPYELKNFSFSAPVVEITSWTRKPEWDTQNRYNDNLFRDTIEIFNENGKLAVINHLPLEYYLKGLWEVSNTDLPEKIKTILVAARSYASYYMERENRKYNTTRYDGSDNPDSFQKYLWYSYEIRSPKVSQLVEQTQWQVLFYENQLIKPWYFSISDGKTKSYFEYCQSNWGKNCENIPYLQSVTDPAGIWKTRSGHWVGISWIGATDFASKGWDYKKIIQYYLSGVTVR